MSRTGKSCKDNYDRLDQICKIWQNEKIITQEMIYKSFRCTGIANNLNRSEDYLFTAWKQM